MILKRLVITHSGEAIVKHFREMQFPELDYHEKPNVKCIKAMRIEPSMNTAVLIERGALLVRNCLFTLRSLPKDLTRKVPSLVALPRTYLTVINSEFVGCTGNLTAGIVTLNAQSAVISSCKFSRFRGGAVYSVGMDGAPEIGRKPTEFLL